MIVRESGVITQEKAIFKKKMLILERAKIKYYIK